MSVSVKICGLCRPEDVQAAVSAGADMLGFVLYERSSRYVRPAALPDLTRDVPPGVLKVGVVVNAEPSLVAEAVDAGGLDIVQFHGDESGEALCGYSLTTSWKAVSLRSDRDVALAKTCPADMVLVDAMSPTARGGTGRRCNWELAAQLAAQRPIVLAGGLRPDNVAEAVRTVHPYAVDVSSGVERCPGVKDHDAVRAFIHHAKQVEEFYGE